MNLPLLTTLYLRLDFPHLLPDEESLRSKWSVPMLQNLVIISKQVVTLVNPGVCLKAFGETLISLTIQQEPNFWTQSSAFGLNAGFWDRLPCLRHLAIDLDIFPFQTPPDNHPLCALVDTGTPSARAYRSMGYHIAFCPQLKTVSLTFEWGKYNEDYGPRAELIYRMEIDAAKGLASVCKAAGVRLEDHSGQTYEEWRRTYM